MNTFESAVKLLHDNPNAVELSRHFDVFVEGLEDLQNRLQVNELHNIKHGAQLDALDARMKTAEGILTSLGNDRNNLMAGFSAYFRSICDSFWARFIIWLPGRTGRTAALRRKRATRSTAGLSRTGSEKAPV